MNSLFEKNRQKKYKLRQTFVWVKTNQWREKPVLLFEIIFMVCKLLIFFQKEIRSVGFSIYAGKGKDAKKKKSTKRPHVHDDVNNQVLKGTSVLLVLYPRQSRGGVIEIVFAATAATVFCVHGILSCKCRVERLDKPRRCSSCDFVKIITGFRKLYCLKQTARLQVN